MKIALCTPFKPIDHESVSGDVTIVRDLRDTLVRLGNEVVVLPHFPAKEIYWRPLSWRPAFRALRDMTRAARGADCWLTYGSYYKVPDVFGPPATARLSMPYCIIQASYARKRRKRWKTRPGWWLNRKAMLAADHIFCNRVNDLAGCARILPPERYSRVVPGLPEGLLHMDAQESARLRSSWRAGGATVVSTVAMMRPGVKVTGLEWVFRVCADLIKGGRDLFVAVAGDGPMRMEMERLGRALLGDRVRFMGMVERSRLGIFFGAGDLFAFPGIQESIGMVYLEAQACGLPVVATDHEGAPHVVADNETGLITRADVVSFRAGVDRLVQDIDLRRRLAANCVDYVRREHDATTNYAPMVETMRALAQGSHI